MRITSLRKREPLGSWNPLRSLSIGLSLALAGVTCFPCLPTVAHAGERQRIYYFHPDHLGITQYRIDSLTEGTYAWRNDERSSPPMKTVMLEVVIERNSSGYFAYCPTLQGCYTQGDSYEETLRNIKDAIRLHLEDRKATRQPLPSPEAISVTTLELTV